MRKLEKCASEINDKFSELMAVEFYKKFGAELRTEFNIISMNLVSTRGDGVDFTPQEHAWIAAFSEGYSTALGVARNYAWNDYAKDQA